MSKLECIEVYRWFAEIKWMIQAIVSLLTLGMRQMYAKHLIRI